MTAQQDKAAAAAAELRELTRAAHEAAQELRQVMREAHEQVDGYLGDEVRKALTHYNEVAQAQMVATARGVRADLQRLVDAGREAMQAVADSHAEIFITLFELTDASTTPPRNDFFERRKQLITIGERLKAAYRAAGVHYELASERPVELRDALERAHIT